MPAAKVYIHEYIDIIGHNRAKYVHHMTANWCPVAREERNQLCYGVWNVVGSTGRWPEVVNMWELDDWDALRDNFAHELVGRGAQDPSLAEWWATAASLRSGGFDRIVIAEPWARSIEQLCADGAGGALYAHELFTVAPGRNGDVLAAVASIGRSAAADLGVELIGAFRVAMADDSEAIALWSFPDWDTWSRYEQEWSATGAMAGWRDALITLGARFRRELLIDAPLAPLRTGRQPQLEDRLPLDQV
ncbi:MAG: NIPSNAP family protein [Acidimicrobiales bacterium]